MSTLGDNLAEPRERLGRGVIQRAHTAIISYMSNLRAHFATAQGERSVTALGGR
ncbi:MAG: hypothetical protein JW990_22440 [Thermoleophilia bacterium]|nr:hypothetical protein [Thermoleophilia bacterium]